MINALHFGQSCFHFSDLKAKTTPSGRGSPPGSSQVKFVRSFLFPCAELYLPVTSRSFTMLAREFGHHTQFIPLGSRGLLHFRQVQSLGRKSRQSVSVKAAASSTAKKVAVKEERSQPLPTPAATPSSSITPKENTVLLQGTAFIWRGLADLYTQIALRKFRCIFENVYNR